MVAFVLLAKKIVARGMLDWTVDERQSVRYGSFYVAPTVNRMLNLKLIRQYHGKHCKITAVVMLSRKSNHADFSLRFPDDPTRWIVATKPKIGEKIVMGIGNFFFEPPKYLVESGEEFVICPTKQREKLWIDPKVLYRLHKQTVEIYMEETEEHDLPETDLVDVYHDKAYFTGMNRYGGFDLQTRVPSDVSITISPIEGKGFPDQNTPLGAEYDIVHEEGE